MPDAPSPGPKQRAAMVRGLILGLVVAGMLTALRGTKPVESVELSLVDWRTRLFAGSRPADGRIVVAQVLEEDVDAVKRSALAQPWPWSLDLNAAIFNVMAKAGVRAVIVDVLHFDRGTGPDEIEGDEPLLPAERQRRELEARSAKAFGDALKAIGRVALAFELTDSPEYELSARVAATNGRLGKTSGALPEVARRAGANLPVRRVLEGAAGLGFANVSPDRDSIVRRASLIGLWGKLVVQGLPLAAAMQIEGGVAHTSRAFVQVGSTTQRTMPDGSFLVNFRSTSQNTYPRVAPSQMLEWAVTEMNSGKLPEAATRALKDKIVVWGVNVSGSDDRLTTPLSFLTDGPVFQATALDNLLHGDGRVHAPRAWNVVILFVLVAVLGAMGGGARRAWIGNVATLLQAAALVAAALALFSAGTSIDLFTPLLGLGLVWGGTSALRALTAGRYNRWLEGTFGRYLAPSIIEAIKDDPSLLVLGGRRRNITVLFSDIAGFTSISRGLEPEQLVRLLNEYLSDSSAAVLAQEGVVDKFEGDAVMAFFGDPLPQEDHAVRACRAALDTLARLPRLQPLLDELGVPEFGVRIGLNSGDAVVGNMGSRERNDYTCMGDTVNLASRLESANKFFGSSILIGAATYEAAHDAILAKPIASLVVVGWDEPVPVFELVALRDADAATAEHVEAFTRAHKAARSGAWSDAHFALDTAEAARPGDGPTAWLREIVTACEQDAPADPWSGRVELTKK